MVWPVLASFLPGFIIIGYNIALIRRLKQATKARRFSCLASSRPNDSCGIRLTIILLLICASHVLLVTPAEIFKYVIVVFNWNIEHAQFVGSIANILQVCYKLLDYITCLQYATRWFYEKHIAGLSQLYHVITMI